MCLQVQNTQELCAAASGKASSVESQARTVANQAKSASQASQHQLAALEKAKAAAGSATTAAEKAVESLRYTRSAAVFFGQRFLVPISVFVGRPSHLHAHNVDLHVQEVNRNIGRFIFVISVHITLFLFF